MSYLENITSAYEQVRAGSSERALVLLALQYENWQNLPRDWQEKIEGHQEYAKLDSAADRPADAAQALVRDCNSAQSSRTKLLLDKVFRLERVGSNKSDAGIGTDAVSWFLANRAKFLPNSVIDTQTAGKRSWCSNGQLLSEKSDSEKSMSEAELLHCIQRLGIMHYSSTRARSRFYYFSYSSGINAVAPNCLDAGLSSYFYQPPERQKAKTRDLSNAALGVSECLVLAPISANQIELIRYKELDSAISIDLSNFISAHAERLQAL